jgi:hypothetical protein
MANTLLNPKVYANAMLIHLKNNLVMGKLVTTEFKNEYKKIGNTLYVKRPPEFVVREGAVAQVQDVVEGEVPIVMDRQRGVDLEFTSLEDTLTVDDLLKSAVMQAQAAQLAQTIDSDLMAMTLEFPSWVGTPGQDINSATDFFRGPERLDLMAIPQDKRCGVLSPLDYWALAGSFTNLPVQEQIAISALERARLPLVGNVQPYMTQSVVNLTTGTRAATGAATIAGANQNVTYASIANNDYKQTLNLANLTAGHTIKAGEVFTIGSGSTAVNFVNPRTKQDTGQLAQFVVLADAVADGSGNVTVTIANPIIISGAYQTVTRAPGNGAAVSFVGVASTAYRQNAVFHKSAIALVFAKLSDPFTGQASYATDPGTGVTVRYWRTSDGVNDTHLHRWDVLYGVKNVDRRLGTRLSGTAS